ncbi:MAG: FAD-dependent oxidoreductase [Vulcanococcus sp.]
MTLHSQAVEVLVWGGGSGGAAAALQAARGGASTLLLTPGAWLGGMVSSAGVCCPDGNELSPWQTGLWGAFLRELARREPQGLDHNWVSCFGYRPATAEAILRDWCRQAPQLRWWPNVQLLAIERQGRRITAVELQRGPERWLLQPQLLIDGSDCGDTFPLADVPHRLGWEARELWDEPSAPPQADLRGDPFFAAQPLQSPTWVVLGQLTPDQPPPPPQEVAPVPPPAVQLAEPFSDAAARFGLERTLSYGRLPGGLVMLNWPLHGNDWHHDLADLISAGAKRRQGIERAMQQHSLHFAAVLQEASGGLLQPGACFPADPADAALAGPSPLALMPYWREGRRLIAQALVREQDLLPQAAGASIATPSHDASGTLSAIAVGNYANDHHYPGPDWPLAPKSCRWGGRWSGTPFTLPYGALVSAGVDNLLAADKATGVSHMANGATRLQPLILNTGQAAGAAAALCIQRGCQPAELPVPLLQQALIADPHAPAAVVPLWDTPWHHPQWRQRQQAVLEDPARLSSTGSLLAAPPNLDPRQAPAEPGERLWQGELCPDGQGGISLRLADGSGCWPVITLEPALHQWLLQLERPRPGALIGCVNPWGPWLRVSRLAP